MNEKSEIQILRGIMGEIPTNKWGEALPKAMDLVESITERAAAHKAWTTGRDNDNPRNGLFNNLDNSGLSTILKREVAKAFAVGHKQLPKSVRNSILRRFNLNKNQLRGYAFQRGIRLGNRK